MRLYLILFIFSVFLFTNCDDINPSNSNTYEKGIFIVNEGNFNAGNGSISYYDDIADTTSLTIFQRRNNRLLGDVAQSIHFHNGLAYIVVNNSNKIEVVDANTFAEVATITNLELPRYFLGIDDNKGYVSQWGADGYSGSLKIIDLNNHSITGTINTEGVGPNKMMMMGNQVIVGHNGGYASDEHFTIIDPSNNEVVDTIGSNYNPDEMAVDANGILWVLSLGYYDFVSMESFPAKLMAYNPLDFSIIKDFELASSYPADLQIDANGEYLYFILDGEVVSQNVSDAMLSLTTIANDSYFYGLGYDDSTGFLYATDATDFTSQGNVKVYNANGSLLRTFNVGVAPGDVIVKK